MKCISHVILLGIMVDGGSLHRKHTAFFLLLISNAISWFMKVSCIKIIVAAIKQPRIVANFRGSDYIVSLR